MNNAVKQSWLRALRSGDYHQGTGALKAGNKFCCLGVLCDLHRKKFGEDWVGGQYEGTDSYLPPSVQEWAELDSENPLVCTTFDGEDGREVSLGELNDSGQADFEDIATVIEENL